MKHYLEMPETSMMTQGMDFEIDAMAAGLDVDELELMDPDDRAEALEEAGLDPDDYDFD